jgi:hypothetical protein
MDNKVEMRTKLSTLWIFVMLNMICADILSFMNSGFLQELMTGYAGEVHITSSFLLLDAIFLEIPIVMVVLSRLLNDRVNRWANLIAGVITILFIVLGGSIAPHYIFFATIEVVCLLIIMRFAWMI